MRGARLQTYPLEFWKISKHGFLLRMRSKTRMQGMLWFRIIAFWIPTAYLNIEVTRMHSACEDDNTHSDDASGLLRN